MWNGCSAVAYTQLPLSTDHMHTSLSWFLESCRSCEGHNVKAVAALDAAGAQSRISREF